MAVSKSYLTSDRKLEKILIFVCRVFEGIDHDLFHKQALFGGKLS